MKIIIKYLLGAVVLITASGSIQAQSNRNSDQAKLPSNRPLPDKRTIERRYEIMRMNTRKQQLQVKMAEQEKSQLLNSSTIDARRPTLKPTVN